MCVALLTIAVLISTVQQSSSVKNDFCLWNINNSTEKSSLRFTKDLTSTDFAYVTQYKSMSCCVTGYTSITWLKNSQPLGKQTTFKVDPDDPQHVESTFVRAGDAGNYTCVARSDNLSINYTVQLVVFTEQQYNGPALPSFRPVDQWAEIGERAQLRCSAFIGFGWLRQLNSELVWMRSSRNWEFADRPGHSEVRTFNYTKGGEIQSTYFTIPSVEEADYGEYVCHVHNGVDPHLYLNATLHRGVDPGAKMRTSYTAVFVLLASLLVVISVGVPIYVNYGLEMRLFLKDRLGKLENSGSCQYDVFVCYSGEDGSQLVMGWLVPYLEQQLGYSCFVFERDTHVGEWMPDTFSSKVSQSRRFLLVLSPGVLEDTMCRFACQLAVQETLGPRSLRLLCLWPPPPQRQLLLEGARTSESLRLIMDVAHSVNLPAEDAPKHLQRRFWREVRLRLPPRRPERPRIYRPLSITRL